MTRPSYMPPPKRKGAPPEILPERNRSLESVEQWDALAAEQAPRVPWDEFMTWWEWDQGQHVGLIGPTGQGKTTLLMSILPRRTYVAVMATKPYDATMDALISTGYVKWEEWRNVPAAKVPRRVVWPDASEIDAEDNQHDVFAHMMRSIYREGKWCLVDDEGSYTSDELGLKKQQRAMWRRGRSLGISYTVATQRPAWVPLEMYDGSTHLFFWRTTERNAILRMSSLGAANEPLVKYLVPRLDQHQTLYVNTRTGDLRRTRTPPPTPVPHDSPPE